jgi:hypothetical protein
MNEPTKVKTNESCPYYFTPGKIYDVIEVKQCHPVYGWIFKVIDDMGCVMLCRQHHCLHICVKDSWQIN